MKSVASYPRRGFTLVELLMVITIIGMLAALLVAGAMRAVVTAKIARVNVEVGMLDTAVQNYKNEIGGTYPPDCTFLGTTSSGPDWISARNNRILAHLRKAFPRFYVNGYGPAATAGTLQQVVQKAFVDYNTWAAAQNPPAPQPPKFPLYPSTPNGSSTWGDLNNLDAAEALVFWLGGLPDVPQGGLQPDGKTILPWSFRLKGFSANKLKPFNLIDSSRLKGPFEFQEQRLGDADGDGWPEYYPATDAVPQPTGSGVASPGNPTAPYVYFDAGSYSDVTLGSFASYPASGQYPPVASGAMPAQPTNSYYNLWGAAIPYASVVSATQITWMNSEKFQIVSASLDSQYYTPGGTPDAFRAFPSGANYSQGDYDNITNFSNGRLQDSMP